jgi:hypothetical protein
MRKQTKEKKMATRTRTRTTKEIAEKFNEFVSAQDDYRGTVDEVGCPAIKYQTDALEWALIRSKDRGFAREVRSKIKHHEFILHEFKTIVFYGSEGGDPHGTMILTEQVKILRWVLGELKQIRRK